MTLQQTMLTTLLVLAESGLLAAYD